MSNPPNPLAQYNTYSYHHILLVCETTEVAEALASSKTFLDFMRRPEDKNTAEEPFGKYNPRSLPGVKGRYIIIINGMTDAEFVIGKLSWFSSTAQKTSKEDAFETLSVEGEMMIEEPRGVKFMNVMATVADKLETDPNGLVFMVKTVFFGHKASSFSENEGYDPVTNIRPIMMVIYDITGEFKITGGTYLVKWAGLNHGASKQRHIMHATDRIKLNLSTPISGCETDTLWGALCRLERKVNEVYTTYFDTVTREVKKAGLRFSGRKVTYKIIAEEPYVKFAKNSKGDVNVTKLRGNPAYKVTDFTTHNKETGKEDEGGMVDFGESVSVESAILQLAKRCPLVKDELVSKPGTTAGGKTKYVPKVSTTIVSSTTEYSVVYKLHRVLESRNDIVARVLKRSGDETGIQAESIQKNLLTLDYFFTGKNTDILKFDVKMEMGLAFFQTLVTTDNLPENRNTAEGRGANNGEGSANGVERSLTPSGKIRKNTPVFLSTKINTKLGRNSQQPDRTATFQFLLNQHAALENLEASVTIHGNPGLLNSMNKPPSEILNRANEKETKANKGDRQSTGTQDVFPYWETTPAIVKLNIRMPSDEEDRDFSQPFWYEGFYYCFGISNQFSDGEFTQTLELISLPQSNPTEDTQQSAKLTQQAQQIINEKNARSSGSATATGTLPTVSGVTQAATEATNAAISAVASNTSLSSSLAAGSLSLTDDVNLQQRFFRFSGRATNPTNADNLTVEQYLAASFRTSGAQ